MRRKELTMTLPGEMERLAETIEVGFLGIVDPDGYPRVVPLNFVYCEGCIYFHGATTGEKFGQFERSPKVSFCFIDSHSLIPSYWIAKDYACPATNYYKSVYLRGTGAIVTDRDEKAMALQALMEKHQPEGKYRRITATEPLYAKALDEVTVFKVIPERIDTKANFGQLQSEQRRRRVIDRLKKRGTERDLRTVKEIEATLQPPSECPVHRDSED